MSFTKSRNIKATRKDATCESCEQLLPVGSAAIYSVGLTDDRDFFAWHAHPECRAAELAWNSWADQWGDEFCWLYMIRGVEDEEDHFAWLREHHPEAAKRVLKEEAEHG